MLMQQILRFKVRIEITFSNVDRVVQKVILCTYFPNNYYQ